MRRLVWIVCALLAIMVIAAGCGERQLSGERKQSEGSADLSDENRRRVFTDIQADRVSLDPISIQRGALVIWTNNDPYTHELSSSEFGVAKIKAGEQWGFVFERPGVFTYKDKSAPNRQYKIIVN